MTLAPYMKYNRFSDLGPFELRIEVYILLLSRTNLRKTEGAAMGSMVSTVIANLHIESYRSNRYPTSEGSGNAMYMTHSQSWFAKTLIACYSIWRTESIPFTSLMLQIVATHSPLIALQKSRACGLQDSLWVRQSLHQRNRQTYASREETWMLTTRNTRNKIILRQ